MASSVSPGDWVQGSEKFLDSTCKKATSGGSAVPRGKIVRLDEATGLWALPGLTLGVPGKHGIVTHINLDADPTFTVMHGGGTGYVTFDDAVQPDGAVYTSNTNNGNVKKFVAAAVFAVDHDRALIGHYKGHADEGDGSSDHPKTVTAAADIGKVTLGATN